MDEYQFVVKVVLEVREKSTGVLHDVLREEVAVVSDSGPVAEAAAEFLVGTGIRLPDLDEDEAIRALSERL